MKSRATCSAARRRPTCSRCTWRQGSTCRPTPCSWEAINVRFWRNPSATLARERFEPVRRPTLFPREPALLAIASGKGGVGKTFLSVNVALALRDLGHRCLVMDLDWGLANVDVALGMVATRHVGHVLTGECSLEDAVIEHQGLAILPNGSGWEGLAHLDTRQRVGLLEAVMSARPQHDFVI